MCQNVAAYTHCLSFSLEVMSSVINSYDITQHHNKNKQLCHSVYKNEECAFSIRLTHHYQYIISGTTSDGWITGKKNHDRAKENKTLFPHTRK
jgi:hypothetical protein